MTDSSRDDLLLEYLDQIPFEPYPVQERALMTWFTSEQGLMLCAPTGTGKTLIAEAALFEALKTGKSAYYTTPLIALTDQKFEEVQAAAVRWGFDPDQVGLVTGNRTINPHAPVKVVVAEVLLNRILDGQEGSLDQTFAVVMDEFHTFNEPERGIVWELTLSMLPKHTRLMLLSATVGNAYEFLKWLREQHAKDLELVQSTDRKVPLTYHWIEDQLLPELLQDMARADDDVSEGAADEVRRTPALVFRFDREGCWTTAETIKGKDVITKEQQGNLAERLEGIDFTGGVGPKLKRLLMRGVGVHHAGVLPKHRRIVEELFQERLLTICVCTETLAAGMNLPARSVVLTDLLKGPVGDKKLIPPGPAHQMFGRAGRPQYDTQGHVYAVAHEDDVKIYRHKLKIEQIPEDTKDPGLMKARKKLIKKGPRRREGFAYWSQPQFEKLQAAEPAKLSSRGDLPWRLLAHLLERDQSVDGLRAVVNKRLLTEPQKDKANKRLTQMLETLHQQDLVVLEPTPPPRGSKDDSGEDSGTSESAKPAEPTEIEKSMDLLAGLTLGGGVGQSESNPNDGQGGGRVSKSTGKSDDSSKGDGDESGAGRYDPKFADPTARLETLQRFRSVHPIYGMWLMKHIAFGDRPERVQVLESLLEVPGSIARRVRVPRPDDLPPGPLAGRIDPRVVQAGLASFEELYPPPPHEQDLAFGERPKFHIPLAQKMLMLFEAQVPHAGRIFISPVWCVGDLLSFDCDFYKYISVRELATQEGMIFRHCLRTILLCRELAAVPLETPTDDISADPEAPAPISDEQWQVELAELGEVLKTMCYEVDSQSTDEVLAEPEESSSE